MNADIREATPNDVPAILDLIRQLAAYEKLSHLVEATEERLGQTLFPTEGKPAAKCIMAFVDGKPAGYAVYFTTYSTFLAKPGLYLEDLFVKPELRNAGSVERSSFTSHGWPANAAADEWNGLSWIGTDRRSNSMRRSERKHFRTGGCAA